MSTESSVKGSREIEQSIVLACLSRSQKTNMVVGFSLSFDLVGNTRQDTCFQNHFSIKNTKPLEKCIKKSNDLFMFSNKL